MNLIKGIKDLKRPLDSIFFQLINFSFLVRSSSLKNTPKISIHTVTLILTQIN